MALDASPRDQQCHLSFWWRCSFGPVQKDLPLTFVIFAVMVQPVVPNFNGFCVSGRSSVQNQSLSAKFGCCKHSFQVLQNERCLSSFLYALLKNRRLFLSFRCYFSKSCSELSELENTSSQDSNISHGCSGVHTVQNFLLARTRQPQETFFLWNNEFSN